MTTIAKQFPATPGLNGTPSTPLEIAQAKEIKRLNDALTWQRQCHAAYIRSIRSKCKQQVSRLGVNSVTDKQPLPVYTPRRGDIVRIWWPGRRTRFKVIVLGVDCTKEDGIVRHYACRRISNYRKLGSKCLVEPEQITEFVCTRDPGPCD